MVLAQNFMAFKKMQCHGILEFLDLKFLLLAHLHWVHVYIKGFAEQKNIMFHSIQKF